MINKYVSFIFLLNLFLFSKASLALEKNENFRLSTQTATLFGVIKYNSDEVNIQIAIPASCENPRYSVYDQSDENFNHIYYVSLIIKNTSDCIHDLKMLNKDIGEVPKKIIQRILLVQKGTIIVFGRPPKSSTNLNIKIDDDKNLPEEEDPFVKLIDELKLTGTYKGKGIIESQFEKSIYDYLKVIGDAAPQTLTDANIIITTKGKNELIKTIRRAGFFAANTSDQAVQKIFKNKNNNNNNLSDENESNSKLWLEKVAQTIQLREADDGGAIVVGSLKPVLGKYANRVDITFETPVELLYNGELNLVASANHTARLELTPSNKLHVSSTYNYCDQNSQIAVGQLSNSNSCSGASNVGAESSLLIFKGQDLEVNANAGVIRDLSPDTNFIGIPTGGNFTLKIIY